MGENSLKRTRITLLVTREADEDIHFVKTKYGRHMTVLAGLSVQFADEWKEGVEKSGSPFTDMKILSAPVALPTDTYYFVIRVECQGDVPVGNGYREAVQKVWDEGIAGFFEIVDKD